MSDKNTGKTVSFSLDLDNPPPLTAEQLRQLDHLRSIRDEDIDFSDIPRQSGLGKWNRPGHYGGPVGQLRLAVLREKLLADGKLLLVDDDVHDSLRQAGDASQNKMNAILREYVEAHRKTA